MCSETVVIRGGGDLASGIAYTLFTCGFNIIMLEIASPLAVRRTVSFAQAVFDGKAIVEDIEAIQVEGTEDIFDCWNEKCIPIMVDENCRILDNVKPDILIDCIMAKKNLGTTINMAPITIGIGPGFTAGLDVHAVIETKRGHDLGRIILNGCAEENTSLPGSILGYDLERLIKSPISGRVKTIKNIGDLVKKDNIICFINNKPVSAQINGILRGLVMNNIFVEKDVKIGDIDPRCKKEYCYTISDKARTIAGSTLQAILYFKNLFKVM